MAEQLELTTNTVAQCVQQQNSSGHATIDDSWELMGIPSTGKQQEQEKQLMGNFSVGTHKVTTGRPLHT